MRAGDSEDLRLAAKLLHGYYADLASWQLMNIGAVDLSKLLSWLFVLTAYVDGHSAVLQGRRSQVDLVTLYLRKTFSTKVDHAILDSSRIRQGAAAPRPSQGPGMQTWTKLESRASTGNLQT